ncbi:MAG: serine/threonine protein kinase [Fischerella sp.]|nr:serine/threonine protein kinase [Fischerella sp.]
MSNQSEIHCINPDCLRPYPQPWGNKFCNCCGAPLRLIDRYIPTARLGSGGFAQIYTVWDQKTQTEKVLKVLIEDSPKALELFAQEAVVLSSLRHPGVPRVESDGYFQHIWSHSQKEQILPCLVMEKINGLTLEDILYQYYPQGCPQQVVLNWLTQAVEILQHLHQRHIIHRDIKPSNLMLRTSPQSSPDREREWGGQLVLIDFGGAKQFDRAVVKSLPRSTKLFSSGYSPPEQLIGGNIGPTVDFYALGRTMIELLTGKHPADLEDPVTGELNWRKHVQVNSQLADLLDDMMHEDARSRPANAKIIQRRLAQIHKAVPNKIRPIRSITQILRFLSQLGRTIHKGVINSTQIIRKITTLAFRAIAFILRACLDTIWTMILSSISACVGTFIGYTLAYHTSWGLEAGKFLSTHLAVLLGNTEPDLGSEMLLFAGAGWGTAWGLVAAGGYRQRRRFLVASLMGIASYSFGWFILQLMIPKEGSEGLVAFILAAVSLLTLGLGLRSHHMVHAVMAAFGTALGFAFLMSTGQQPSTMFDNNWHSLLCKVAFFSAIGVFISFWLGVSHYLVVPGLRFLGWRQ